VILRSEFPLKIEEMHAMTAPHSIDPGAVPRTSGGVVPRS